MAFSPCRCIEGDIPLHEPEDRRRHGPATAGTAHARRGARGPPARARRPSGGARHRARHELRDAVRRGVGLRGRLLADGRGAAGAGAADARQPPRLRDRLVGAVAHRARRGAGEHGLQGLDPRARDQQLRRARDRGRRRLPARAAGGGRPARAPGARGGARRRGAGRARPAPAAAALGRAARATRGARATRSLGPDRHHVHLGHHRPVEGCARHARACLRLRGAAGAGPGRPQRRVAVHAAAVPHRRAVGRDLQQPDRGRQQRAAATLLGHHLLGRRAPPRLHLHHAAGRDGQLPVPPARAARRCGAPAAAGDDGAGDGADRRVQGPLRYRGRARPTA